MKRKYVFTVCIVAVFIALAGTGLALMLHGHKENIDMVQISYSHYANPAADVIYKIDGREDIARLISYFEEMVYTPLVFDIATVNCGCGLYTVSMFRSDELIREYTMDTGTPDSRYIRFADDGEWYVVSQEDAYRWDSYIAAMQKPEQ